jgi:hypothetical protein
MKSNATLIHTLKTSISCYLITGLFLSPFIIGHAETNTSLQHFQDGWTLENAPTPLQREDHFLPYFTLSINSESINPTLSPNLHPMAHILNQYEVLQVKPNSKLLNWQDNILIDGESKTTNILEQLAPEFFSAATAITPQKPEQSLFTATTVPQQHHSTEKPPLTFGQKVENIADKTVGAFMEFLYHALTVALAIPVALLGFLICSPIIGPLMINEIKADIQNSKDRKIQKKQDTQIKAIVKEILTFKQHIDTLQQSFNPNFSPRKQTTKEPNKLSTETEERSYSSSLQNRYHILPSKTDYTIDALQKKVTYRPNRKPVTLRFNFKPAYPNLEDLKKNYADSSFAKNDGRKLNLSIENQIIPDDSSQPTGYFVTGCTLTYLQHYNQANILCDCIHYMYYAETIDLR